MTQPPRTDGATQDMEPTTMGIEGPLFENDDNIFTSYDCCYDWGLNGPK
jgi:hypothetical protein